MKESVCSFVIITYNQKNTIRASLLSVLEQDYKNFRLIITDDGSTDGTKEEILNVLNEFSDVLKDVVFLDNVNNAGIVSNFNKAIPFITGDFFITQAGDDIAMPDRVSFSKGFFEDNKNCLAFFSSTIDISNENVILCTNYGEVINERNKRLGGVNITNTLFDEAGILGASASYSVSLVNEAAIPYVAFSEDKSLTLRAALRGEVHFVNKCLVKYRRESGVTIVGKTTRKVYSKLMYRRSRFYKSLKFDHYYQYNKRTPQEQNKIRKLRISCMLSNRLLKGKESFVGYLFKSLLSGLLNKVTLRGVHYFIRGGK
ncbi:TPA: glycosyltransferase [Enterobacter cloacae]|uniref:glycosyltransferase n=1 Tax=Enterobacter cloacae TaxID=550 RepID=UPI00069A141D|nr:glycosyltransferase [Enterobacter cloacae]MBF4109701.1 glycosyltransferase [Enterobacter cloacae]MDT8891941.1 glycosyltransferase [Enterobacter cloacae]HCJ6521833.1 glycosyltransferase [Enterobacter cloacae]HEW9968555.1 glycosyltransferase [Enterobacter cloacae]